MKEVQEPFEKRLRMNGWFVVRTHGNAMQSGLPDNFASHSKYGHRWIEYKLPKMEGSVFTAAQIETFPKLCANGSGVWIIMADTAKEYEKLFVMSNFELVRRQKLLKGF